MYEQYRNMDYRVGSFLLFVINIGEGSKNTILHNINYRTFYNN